MKNDPVQLLLRDLSRLRNDPDHADEPLRAALSHRVNLIVAKAAEIARELERKELGPDLAAAFERLLPDAAQRDKGCIALTEIAETLAGAEYGRPEVFRKGMRHVQMEPAFEKPVDAAARLRGICAVGLAQTGSPDALNAALELLVDPEPAARVGAVKALGCTGEAGAALVLRFKVLLGDAEPEIITECFVQLLGGWFDASLPFVAPYLHSGDERVSEAVILALGTTRRREAYEVLVEKWNRAPTKPILKLLAFALSTLRIEESIAFLLARLETEPPPIALEIISAMALYRHDTRVFAKLEAIIAKRNDASLKRALASVSK